MVVYALALSPNGGTVAVAVSPGATHDIRLSNLATGALMRTLSGHSALIPCTGLLTRWRPPGQRQQWIKRFDYGECLGPHGGVNDEHRSNSAGQQASSGLPA